jgi:tetratricopeptide (TPR) repeat protein
MESQFPSKEFGRLESALDKDGRLQPAVEYLPLAGEKWQHVRWLWLTLPDHPALLPAIESTQERLLLRYPALTGDYRPNDTLADFATLGARLADAYRTLLAVVGEDDIGHFTRPFFKVDAAERLRIGFKPSYGWTVSESPETKKTWPRCDQRALVYLIGEWVTDRIVRLRHDGFIKLTNRCRERKPDKRYQTLDELHEAFAALGPIEGRWTSIELRAWRTVETSIGWLELGNPERAIEQLEQLPANTAFDGRARAIRELAREALRERDKEAKPSKDTQTTLSWSAAESEARRYEASGDLLGALRIYTSVLVDAENESAVFGARARLHFALGHSEHAIECAKRAIAGDATRVDLRVLLIKALVERGQPKEALAEVGGLLAISADNALHHYLHGKVLLALGRLTDARAAFEHASQKDPKLLEAMLLRREVDRAIAVGRRVVGSQGPIAFDIPESLAELRDVLISGRTKEAVAALMQPRFSNNADAQLVLARLLANDGQTERALEIYDRIASMPDPHRHNALVGKATLLLDQRKFDVALALFDVLCAEKPNDIDASEGRARTLEQLGRVDEASAEYRRCVAIATKRSDIRVRAAELWLDQHK